MSMRLLFIFLFLFGFGTLSFAQMTDDQVVELLKKAQREGKTQQEMLVLLKERGVPQEQLLRLKSQYERMMAGEGQRERVKTLDSRLRTASVTAMTALDSLFVLVDTTKVAVDRSNEVFGKALFNNQKLTFEPLLNIPTPENYKLAAGDEVIIDVWGDSEQSIQGVISPDGSIIVENLGPIFLSGLSIKEANIKIKNELSKIYSAISAAVPTTFVKLSLGQIRSIQVNVMGEVQMPGSYTLSSLASVFHALYSAGGVNDIGSLREINLFRDGQKIATLDVYKYLLEGGDIGNIILQEGDNIIVGPYKALVKVRGKVKRPMIYEMAEKETLQNLLDYAGGFSGDAYRKNVRLTRKSGGIEHRIHTVMSDDFASFQLNDGDVVEVDSIISRYENLVEIKGAVYRPGTYSIDHNIRTVKQLVDIAEGVTGDAFMERVLLYRENPDLTRQVQSLNLNMIFSGADDMELKRNDVLYIPSMLDLQENFIVYIQGDVKNPGTFPYVKNMALEDLVLQAGGLLESASVVRVDVARRIKNPKSKEEADVAAQFFTFALKDGLVIDGPKDFTLEPFDEIYVRRSPGYSEQQNVVVEGEVLFDGVYTKIAQDERLSSVIRRAGGVSSKAYVQGARLERKMNADERRKVQAVLKLTQGSDKDSVDVSRLDIGDTYFVGIELDKALANPGSDYDIVLREGDRIIVPIYTGTVKVGGAVMYPNTVAYNSKTKLKDYIGKAGGFGVRAKRGGIYIVYMNGTVAKKKGNGAKQIQPGCEIIVPTRPIRKGMSLAEIMSMASSTTSMAAMVTSIINSTK